LNKGKIFIWIIYGALGFRNRGCNVCIYSVVKNLLSFLLFSFNVITL
jgi:hypothetical protein